jgi:hypothetical protein
MTTPVATDLSQALPSESPTRQTEFANPRLKPILTSARIPTTSKWSWPRSIFFEASAWLTIPLGVPVFLLVLIPVALVPVPIPLFGLVKFVVAYGITIQIIASIFYRLRRRAQRHRVNALADLRKDGRDPVLYLRSFFVDADKSDERLDLRTDEEVLTLALREVGPVLAIGSPGKPERDEHGADASQDVPLLGATRIYFMDKDWQEAVADLMEISRVVVINAGISEGLLWEIEAAIRNAGPSKLLISFLPWRSLDGYSRNARYQRFRSRAERVFREALQKGVEKGDAPVEDFKLPSTLGGASFLSLETIGKPSRSESTSGGDGFTSCHYPR